MSRVISLVRDGRPHPPELDTAISRATLRMVSTGELPETLRLHRPGAIVAFGPRDRMEPGFAAAVAGARSRGFGAVERLAGGRAAVFHEGTIAFSWAIPDPSPREGILSRFQTLAEIVRDAFLDLGVDARIGDVPGEYCPGEHSINARGRTKLMGVGQRVVAGAAHVGGVVVVSGAERVREVLVPVYAALGLAWDPATVGSLEDEIPGVTWERAEEAVVGSFARRYELRSAPLAPETVALGRRLAAERMVG